LSDGKIRREVLIGYLLIAGVFFMCIIAYFVVRIQVDAVDLTRLDVRGSISNLAMLLTLLAVACIFLGAISGYIIGKYGHL